MVTKETDSVRLWKNSLRKNKNDVANPLIYKDFAPVASFEVFMKNEPIPYGE